MHTFLQLQAESRCQPTASRMAKRESRCIESQRRLGGGGTRTEDETATKHRWHPSRSVKHGEEEMMKIVALLT